jgi:deoxyribodipyrimidine photo-lyase
VVRCARQAGAASVFLAEDVSTYARRRERALVATRLDVRVSPGLTVIPPGAITPSDGRRDHFAVFTPYWNRWRDAPRRSLLAPPGSIRLPDGLASGRVAGAPTGSSPARVLGGESNGRRRLDAWIGGGLGAYGSGRDLLAEDSSSRLSAFLRFGCISPLEVVERTIDLAGGDAFVRQLCWRDFHYQLFAARPELSTEDLRPRGDHWRDDADALEAWKDGRTGYPLVDAGMRQLHEEGFMHNRARLVTASFLTKHLYVDWRAGAAHFASHLLDGDVPSNVGNWQWVAGTGADTRPNRTFNPERQARRYDPDGAYVRRWVPELGTPSYPTPIVGHADAVARFRAARAAR